MKFQKIIIAVLFFGAAITSRSVWAGQATVSGTFIVDEEYGHLSLPMVSFFNPNDVPVDLKFVLLHITSADCINTDPEDECSNPSGEIDGFDALEGGLQTVEIPPVSQFMVHPFQFKPDDLASFSNEDFHLAPYVIQATWEEHILSGSGAVRTITPIKVFQSTYTLQLDGYGVESLLGSSSSQFQ